MTPEPCVSTVTQSDGRSAVGKHQHTLMSLTHDSVAMLERRGVVRAGPSVTLVTAHDAALIDVKPRDAELSLGRAVCLLSACLSTVCLSACRLSVCLPVCLPVACLAASCLPVGPPGVCLVAAALSTSPLSYLPLFSSSHMLSFLHFIAALFILPLFCHTQHRA